MLKRFKCEHYVFDLFLLINLFDRKIPDLLNRCRCISIIRQTRIVKVIITFSTKAETNNEMFVLSARYRQRFNFPNVCFSLKPARAFVMLNIAEFSSATG